MRKSKGIAKRVVATACSAAMAVAFAPAIAFADGTTTANAGADGNGVVLTVQTAQLQDSSNKAGTIKTPKDGTSKVVKTYTAAQLQKLAAQNKTAHYQYAGKGAATVVTTSSYVTLSQLLGGMDNWNSKSSVSYQAADGFGNSVDYATAAAPAYYFPGYSSAEGGFSTAGKVQVPAALTLTSKKTSVPEGSTAGEAVAADTTAEGAQDSLMFVRGESEADYTAGSLLRGNVFATGVTTLTVGPTDGSAPVTERVANTLKLGKSKVTVKKGKSVKVAVKGAKGKVTVKSSKAKVAKASYSAKTKKVTVKGLKKGTATVTVKAAGNSGYKAGSQTLKVTVRK